MKALPIVFLFCFNLLSSAPNFIPPSNHKCVQALGETKDIDPTLRPLFLNTLDINPIPIPGPNDWLSSQREQGQTYDQFKAGRFNTPTEKHPFLYLQPIGTNNLATNDVAQLKTYCSAFFNTKVKILPPIPLSPNKIRTRTNPYTNKGQLHAGDVLKELELNKPKDAYAVIAFSMVDLYPEESWNFVFGLANLRQSVGVFSFARYGEKDTNRSLFMERSLKIMTHEIGHMYGMKHCTYYHCLMNGSNTLDETDRAPMHLCPVCLRKLDAATSPDHLMRYTKLKKTYQKLDLENAENFARIRVEMLLKEILNR